MKFICILFRRCNKKHKKVKEKSNYNLKSVDDILSIYSINETYSAYYLYLYAHKKIKYMQISVDYMHIK